MRTLMDGYKVLQGSWGLLAAWNTGDGAVRFQRPCKASQGIISWWRPPWTAFLVAAAVLQCALCLNASYHAIILVSVGTTAAILALHAASNPRRSEAASRHQARVKGHVEPEAQTVHSPMTPSHAQPAAFLVTATAGGTPQPDAHPPPPAPSPPPSCCKIRTLARFQADVYNGDDATPVVASPVCPLTYASAASAVPSGHTSSVVDSGQSAVVPGDVVNSILSVTALRRSRLRYRTPHLGGSVAAAAAAATVTTAVSAPGAPFGVFVKQQPHEYRQKVQSLCPHSRDQQRCSLPQLQQHPQEPPSRRTQLHIKLPGADPSDLAPGFLGAVGEALRVEGCGLQLVGAAVRRGCIELTLDFLEPEPHSVDATADKPLTAFRVLHGCGGSITSSSRNSNSTIGRGSSAAGAGDSRALTSGELALPALVLHALQAHALRDHRHDRDDDAAAAAGTGADDEEEEEEGGDDEAGVMGATSVFVQRGGVCWELQWDRESREWQVCGVQDVGLAAAGAGAGGGDAAGDAVGSGGAGDSAGGDAGSGPGGVSSRVATTPPLTPTLVPQHAAVLAADQLASGAGSSSSGSGCGLVRLPVTLRGIPSGLLESTIANLGVFDATEEEEDARAAAAANAAAAPAAVALPGPGPCSSHWDAEGATTSRRQPFLQQPLQQLSFVSKANGRTTLVRVLSVSRSGSDGLATSTNPSPSCISPAQASDDATATAAFTPATSVPIAPSDTATTTAVAITSDFTLLLEFDLGHLVAGRPATSQGLVVRLELWRGPHVLTAASLACMYDATVVSELLDLQRDVASAGLLDPEDEGYLSPAQQQAEMEELLGDLRAWLDFVAATTATAVAPGGGSTAAAEGEMAMAAAALRDPLDLSRDLGGLLTQPEAAPVLLGAGQHLLEYFVFHGLVALAGAVRAEWAPRQRAAGEQAGTHSEADGGEGQVDGQGELTLLHRAVRSGNRAMVEQVLTWAAEDGGAAAADVAWAARGPGGVTPLHLLAADARCGETATATPPYGIAGGGGADGVGVMSTSTTMQTTAAAASEALLRWVVSSFPAAVKVWSTARDSSSNTSAMLWAALGGQDVLLQAAAAALEHEAAEQALPSTTAEGACAFTFAAAATTSTIHPAHPSSSTGLSSSHAGPSYAPHVTAAATITTTTTADECPSSSTSISTANTNTATVHNPMTGSGMEAQLLSPSSPPPSPRALLGLALRGFPTRDLEERYVRYVTATTLPSTLIWLVVMVVAHLTAAFKSPTVGESRQAYIGGAAYVVSLVVMIARPAVYTPCRERLMLSCLLGRTACRAMMVALPQLFSMSESVQKYVHFGLDVLLDGFMEGTFEQVRLRRLIWARLLDWHVTALFMLTLGVRGSYGSALLRSAAVCATGLAMSGLMDVRTRGGFLREMRRQRAEALERKMKAE